MSIVKLSDQVINFFLAFLLSFSFLLSHLLSCFLTCFLFLSLPLFNGKNYYRKTKFSAVVRMFNWNMLFIYKSLNRKRANILF